MQLTPQMIRQQQQRADEIKAESDRKTAEKKAKRDARIAEGTANRQDRASVFKDRATQKAKNWAWNQGIKQHWGGIRPAGRLGWGATKLGGRALKTGALATGAVVGAGAGAVINKTSEAGSSAIFIFLSILLYFLDITLRFNGIVIRDFSLFTADFIQTVFLNGAVLVLLIAYAVIYKPNMRDYFSTAILIWTFSLVFFLGGFGVSGLFHSVFIIFLYIFLIRPSSPDKAAANYTTAILVLFDYFGYGLLGYYFSSTAQFSQATVYLTSRLILPVWFYYTLILTHDQKKSWFTSSVIFLVICVNVFYFAQAFGAISNKSDILTEADIKEGMAFWREGIEGTKSFITNVWNTGKKAYVDGLIYATGGYYDAIVEENEKEPLGVYIDDITEPNINYYESEAISQWWTLKARTLDKEKKIEIALECYADYETDKLEGTHYPDKKIEVYNLEERDIACNFKEFQLTEGSRKISMFADFNFQTMSYLKRYFMDLETMRTMNREEIDILSYYKIIDRDPITKYTSGPIKLGIGGISPLTGITTAHDNQLRLGFSLEKGWEGKISKINELTVYLPSGIEFDDDLCNGEFKSEGVQKLGEEEVNVYSLTDKAKNSTKRLDKEKMSFNCKIKVDSGAVDDVLGITPITIKYFRVATEYDFKLEKTKTISVQREKGFNVRISPTEPKSEDNLYCTATHSKEKFENVRSQFFKEGVSTPLTDYLPANKIDDKVYRSLPLPKAKTEREDIIYCKMKAELRGSEELLEAESGRVTIRDTPPVFKNLNFDNGLCSGIAYDEDGDVISAVYQFLKGNDPLLQKEVSCSLLPRKEYECKAQLSDVDNSRYTSGDVITCSMTPHSYGTPGNAKSTSWRVP